MKQTYEEQNKQTHNQPEPQEARENTHTPSPSTNKKPFKSRGWRIHNELTYRGIDWVLNSFLGTAFAFWSSRTDAGKKYFQKPFMTFFEKILSPIISKTENRVEGAKWGTTLAGIMVGGFAIIPLMMYMENKENKKKIVRWLDEKMYGKEAVENDPRFEEAYKRIDEEPKKGFWHGMAARFIAVTPIFLAISNPKVNSKLMQGIYDPIANFTKNVAKKIGIKPSKDMLEKGERVPIKGNPDNGYYKQSNWDALHQTFGFDFGLTIFYAIMHEYAYKALASLGMKKEEAETAEQPQSAFHTKTRHEEDKTRSPEPSVQQDTHKKSFASKERKTEHYADEITRERKQQPEMTAALG